MGQNEKVLNIALTIVAALLFVRAGVGCLYDIFGWVFFEKFIQTIGFSTIDSFGRIGILLIGIGICLFIINHKWFIPKD